MATNNLINSVQTRNVYVSNQGSDTTGNGTISYPYATIGFALTQITTASAANVFQILCDSGVYTETAISLKPWVNIDGGNSKLTVSGAITLIGFASGGQIAFGNFFGLTVSGGITLNPATAALSIINLYDLMAETSINLTITGATTGSNGTFVLLDNLNSKFGFFVPVFSDLDGYVTNSSFNSLTYSATSTVVNHQFDFYSNYIENGVLIQRTGAGLGVISDWVANRVIGTFSVTGTNAIVRMDVDSCTQLPTASGGATLTFVNLADTLLTNYTPVNFTPTNTSVKGAVTGIDNKLAAFNYGFNTAIEVTGTSQTAAVRTIYVANNAGAGVNFTLPATCAVGDTIAVLYKGAGGWRLTANTGQTIRVSNQVTAAAGTVTTSAAGNCITIICITANTEWETINFIGTLTVV